jgi:hypothetical protein
LSATLLAATATDWSRDGQWLVFYTTDPGSGRDLWGLPMGQRDAKAQRILATSAAPITLILNWQGLAG